MDRRGFLGTLIGGLAGSVAVRQWPFRVYSFPAEPVLAPLPALADSLFVDTPLMVYYQAAMAINGNQPRSQHWVTNIEALPQDPLFGIRGFKAIQ